MKIKYIFPLIHTYIAVITVLTMLSIPSQLLANMNTSKPKKIGIVTGLDPHGDGFLTLRSKPNGKKITDIYNRAIVKVLDKRGKWYKVKYHHYQGWVYGKWLKTGLYGSSSMPNKGIKSFEREEGEEEGDMDSYELYGQGDSCSFSIGSDISLFSTCKVDIDSKGYLILCTPKKRFCKRFGDLPHL